MSTITKEFTKEQLIEQAKKNIEVLHGAVEKIPGASDAAVIHLKLAEITLASLEAEPAGWQVKKHGGDWVSIKKEDVDHYRFNEDLPVREVYTATPAPVSVPDYPDVLPCPVMLEPGLRFGKGVPTKTMLGALQRRAGYHAELEAMTPEQRAEHDAGMKEFAAMLQGADVSLTHEGKNHHEDKLGMVNHLGDVTEKVEPVTQIEPVADLYGLTSPTGGETSFTFDAVEARDFIDGGWSCQEYVELERFQEAVSGNSPVIPDGWKLVPIDPTKDMLRAGQSVVGFWLNTVHCYSKMLAAAPAAPKQEVTQALAKGMERYGDAMQKLADSGD